jgi:hypothetical protein
MAANGHIVERPADEARRLAEDALAGVNTLIEETRQLGCELKDIDMELVGFSILRDGRAVYLCWRLGEDTVRWWHEREPGYAGRRPFDEQP